MLTGIAVAEILQSVPMPSHVMTHPELARTFEAVATEGHKGFYEGRIAKGIPALSQTCTH